MCLRPRLLKLQDMVCSSTSESRALIAKSASRSRYCTLDDRYRVVTAVLEISRVLQRPSAQAQTLRSRVNRSVPESCSGRASRETEQAV